MKTQSIDTDVKSEKILIDLLREKSIAEKFDMVRSLSQSMIELSKRAIARANKGIDDDQVNIMFVELHYGRALAQGFKKQLEKRSEST